jgi:DNA-binding transcriptional ArsR family regulator
MYDTVFKALSDPHRRAILQQLKVKEMTVSELLTHFHFTQATLSHHLDVLKRARLVTPTREGQFIRYALNLSVFEELSAWFLEEWSKFTSKS